MAVYEQPTFDKWKLRDWPAGPPDAVRAARQEMLAAAGENARRLGTGSPDASQIARIIGTGHQAWLWHPGILAKDVRTWRLAEKAAPATAQGPGGWHPPESGVGPGAVRTVNRLAAG